VTTLKVESIGPVDVAVILFEGNRFNGDVAPAIMELQDGGTVRIIDLAFVSKDSDGMVTAVEVADSELAGQFLGLTQDQMDLLSDEDLERVGEEMEPGNSALVIVWENSWASRLAVALRGSHGRVVSLDRIPHEIVAQAIKALDEKEAS
jgi:uncharacterized membrane protein